MRKSVVFALVLATMFFLGISNARAGIGPAFFDCFCQSRCEGGVPVNGFGAVVEYPGDSFVPSEVEITSVEVMYDGMIEPLTPVDPPPPVILSPGNSALFVSPTSIPGLPPGEFDIECIGQYSYLNGPVDGIVPLNSGGEFRGPGTCFVETCAVEVSVDIRPQSCPNPLNTKAKGFLPVAILGTPEFDPTTVDPATVALGRADGVGGAVAPNLDPPGPQPNVEDVGTPFNGAFSDDCYDCTEDAGDGLLDLTLKFSIPDLLDAIDGGLQDGDCVPLQLTAETFDGTPFTGADNVLMRVK